MILDFEDLKNYEFHLWGINVFHQKPSYRELQQKSRQFNGFLYILHGEGRYLFEENSFSFAPGALIYLPAASSHTLIIDSAEMEFYRIDFNLSIDGEIVLFSNSPLKMYDSSSAELEEAIHALADQYQFAQDTIAKTEILCRIFRALYASAVSPRKEKLAPAIRYLLEHLTDKIDCRGLAKICSLSTAQFYNLFREEYGMAPLEYRNHLLMEKASLLLKDGSFFVTEVAETLGFESVSYFSRFFKKHKGISPAEYRKKKAFPHPFMQN